jgi:hypothetical protein
VTRPDAGPTQFVALEPREQVVGLVDLSKIPPPLAHAARVADSGATGDALGGYVVRAVIVMLKAGALTPATLGTRGAHANLVNLAGLATARDEPAAAALVVGEYLLAHEFGDAETSQNVTGGFLPGTGYTGADHEALPSWSGPRGVEEHRRGHLFINVCSLAYCMLFCLQF